MHSSRMCTAHMLPYEGLPDRETPWTETLPPSRQRPPRQKTPWTETPGQRHPMDIDPLWTETPP